TRRRIERGHRNGGVVHLGPAMGHTGARRKVKVGEIELPGRLDGQREVLNDAEDEKDKHHSHCGHLDTAVPGFWQLESAPGKRRRAQGRSLVARGRFTVPKRQRPGPSKPSQYEEPRAPARGSFLILVRT